MNLGVLFDIGLTVPVFGLIGISLSILGSTTPTLFSQQLIFFLVGIFLFLIFSAVDFRIWSRFSWIFYIFSLFFLIASFASGEVRGASRWIDIAGIRVIQPSELLKPFVILFLTGIIIDRERHTILDKLKPFIFFLPILIIIFKQPDLGNVLVYFLTFIALELASGLPLLYFFIGAVLSGVVLPFFWFVLKQYQKVRLLAFFNPQADPVGIGYNAIQAMIAIGSGQLFGMGLGRGTQSHLLFLPEYHTDFVFASLGEELGFLGTFAVIIFYFILLLRILQVMEESENNFGKLLVIGIFAQIFIQVFINIGMNLGIMPITGITLPLLSYGGSSIISTFIDLGLVASVARVSKNRHTLLLK
ncbi:MAG: rod shape-determining protein RodA [Patescibacteria group bacterium]|nr:rod shape-determining protein RodA [Patescibacteria group bacterium]